MSGANSSETSGAMGVQNDCFSCSIQGFQVPNSLAKPMGATSMYTDRCAGLAFRDYGCRPQCFFVSRIPKPETPSGHVKQPKIYRRAPRQSEAPRTAWTPASASVSVS